MTVYFIQRPDKTIKIGTAKVYDSRQPQLRSQYGEFELLGLMDGDRDYEVGLHKRFAHLNTGKDGREWFYPSDELMRFIQANTALPAPKPAKQKAKQYPARIPVDDETLKLLHDFAVGLGVSMNDAILFMLSAHMEAGDDPLLIGYANRERYKQSKS